MIIVRFKVQSKLEKIGELEAAFRDLVAASQPLDGVISFDMGRDLTDPASFLALEIFENRAALDRQESLPATQKAIALLEDAAAAAPEATIFTVSSSEPWG